jgi:hypothetical protein
VNASFPPSLNRKKTLKIPAEKRIIGSASAEIYIDMGRSWDKFPAIDDTGGKHAANCFMDLPDSFIDAVRN